jgi:hypothetical protein
MPRLRTAAGDPKSVPRKPRVVTTKTVLTMKQTGEKIAMLTAYDFLVAKYLDQVGVDIILVGDSLGNVVQGHATTLPVTVDDMIYHAVHVVPEQHRRGGPELREGDEGSGGRRGEAGGWEVHR